MLQYFELLTLDGWKATNVGQLGTQIQLKRNEQEHTSARCLLVNARNAHAQYKARPLPSLIFGGLKMASCEILEIVDGQNRRCCQFADIRTQRLYCGESGVVLCLNQLKDSFRWWAMLDYEKEEEEEEEEERRKKMTKSEFYSDLSLDSRVLSGTFKSVFVNC